LKGTNVSLDAEGFLSPNALKYGDRYRTEHPNAFELAHRSNKTFQKIHSGFVI